MTPVEAYNQLEELLLQLDLKKRKDLEGYNFRINTLRLLGLAIQKANTSGPGGNLEWGDISGVLLDQTDLATALNNKAGLYHTHHANDSFYDNNASGLTADDVQEAITELKGIIDALPTLTVTEENSTPINEVDDITIIGATVTDEGGGKIKVTVENSPTLTVTGGDTTVNTVDNITFTGATVIDDGSGDVTIEIESAPSTFESDITVALSGGKTLGKYENGDTIPSTGLTFEAVMNLIAQETINPTFANPAFSTSLSPNQTYEVGTAYTGTFTGTLDRGKILGDIVAGVWDPTAIQGFRSGAVEEYILDGTTQASNSLSVTRTLINGTNTFNATVKYLASDIQPLNSVGGNFDEPLAAGSLNSSKSITARYKQFFGVTDTTPTTSEEVRNLSNSNYANISTFITPAFSDIKFVIAIPATRNLVRVVTSNNETIFEEGEPSPGFVLDTFNVNDAGGTPVSYKVYTFTSVSPLNTTTTVTLSGS